MSARPRRTLMRLTTLLAAVLLVGLPLLGSSASAAPQTFVPISGAGSSWAYPAIDQWGIDIQASSQITINFNPEGSAAGRLAFIENQKDFAASDIAFLTQGDPFGGGTETESAAYSYIPIVAGGTSFLYNLKVGTRKITNLRLSGDTLTKIFTGQITNWDDPRITRDYGSQLPSEHITPVTRADGAGASYEFTKYMATVYAPQWNAFCHAHGGPTPCGPTEFYPTFAGSVQKNGSDQVANYIDSSTLGAGSIGYDEYAYALDDKIPVVNLENSAGYFVGPTAYNVAIALQAAVINEDPTSVDFLIQDLDKVYTNPDPRTYPLSSYSYLIVPRNSRIINGNNEGPPTNFNTNKGATLSTWLNYVLCGAQQSAAQLGYSPLPENLVTGGFTQDQQIPGAVPIPDLANYQTCNNPTYSAGKVNLLTKDAPFPSKCAYKVIPASCTAGTPAINETKSPAGNGTTAGTPAGTAAAGAAAGTGKAGTTAAKAGTSSTGGTAAAAGGAVDPDTGQVATAQEGTVSAAYASAVNIGGHGGGDVAYAVLTTLEILGAIAIPTVLGARLQKRNRQRRAS